MAGTCVATTRGLRLINQALGSLELDLAGARVLTEAATNAYAATAVLAASAGATVHALARDSMYGSSGQAIAHVQQLGDLAGLSNDRIQYHVDRESLPGEVDIITNSAGVRPLDASMLLRLGPSGAVTVMFESWELRPNEIDLAFCRQRGIPVAGVWEDFGGLEAFASCGILAVKLCLSAGLEVTGNRIVVISNDPFGKTIVSALVKNRADVSLIADATQLDTASLGTVDALVVAAYDAEAPVLGGTYGPSPDEIASANRDLVIVQFVGPVDVQSFAAAGLRVFPDRQLGPRQMAATLDQLGPRPVIYLSGGGLKVGELLWKKREQGKPFGRFERLVQMVDVDDHLP